MRFSLVALLALTALRLVVAATAPLSPDEAYYWVWSRALAGGYYDHPPMVALWIRTGTYLCGETELGVRLLAPLSTALGSVLFAYAGTVLTGDRARGVMAAALLNATLAFGVGAVTMTPDTPLLFFWVCALAAAARFLSSGRGAWLAALGACAGLALISKFTALFLGLAVALWFVMMSSLRPWLRRPWPWLAGSLALAVFMPVLVWNFTHDWAGLTRQSGRLGGFRPGEAFYFFAEFIAGQIGMLTPGVFGLACAGVWAARRRRDPASVLLLLLTLLPLPVFAEHALADRVQANWPAIVYPSAVLLAVTVRPRWHRAALWLGAAMIVPVYVQASWPVLPLPVKFDPSMKRLAGWAEFARAVEAARQAQGAAFVIADNYPVAAMLAWHMPANATVIAAQPRWGSFALPHPDLAGQPGLWVHGGRLPPAPPFAAPKPIGEVARARGGTVAETFQLYAISGLAASASMVALPVRGAEPQ